MAGIFEMVDRMFAGVVPVADFLWDFPTNYAWYSGIPILGQFSLAILLLLGGSFYFTFKFNFVQMKEFKTGLKLLTAKTKAKVGTTQLAAFLISMAGRGRQYRGCYGRCHDWRPGRDFLDVDICLCRHGNLLWGGHPGADIQGEKGR